MKRQSTMVLRFAGFLICALGLTTPSMASNFVVDSTEDNPDISVGDGECETVSGSCSMRAAIMELNSELVTDSVLSFSPAVKGEIVQPGAPLPVLRVPLVLDAAAITESDGSPGVTFDFSRTGGGAGFVFSAGGTVRGVSIVGASFVGVSFSRNGRIESSFVGVFPDGRILGNRGGGVLVGADSIVGATEADSSRCSGGCNRILGNGSAQVQVTASNVQILGNQIGTNGLAVFNPFAAVAVLSTFGGTSLTNVTVGNTQSPNLLGSTGESPVSIGFPGDSLVTRVNASHNRFVHDSELLVDLGGDGRTLNDAGDSDSGPNRQLNAPFIESASVVTGCILQVRGVVGSGQEVVILLERGTGTDHVEYDVLYRASEGSSADISSGQDSYDLQSLGADDAERFGFDIPISEVAAFHRIVVLAVSSNGSVSESSNVVDVNYSGQVALCSRVCYSDEDGDGARGTQQIITTGVCAARSSSGLAWASFSDDDCDDDPASACSVLTRDGGAETCDECDNDCDGLVDEADPGLMDAYYPDVDGDGCGSGQPIFACEPPNDDVASNNYDQNDADGVCCGNGIREAGESCDGLDIGPTMCPSGLFGIPECENQNDFGSGDCHFASPSPAGCAEERVCYSDEDGDGVTGTGNVVQSNEPCSSFSSGPNETAWSPESGGDCNDILVDSCAVVSTAGAADLCDGCDNDCDPETPDGAGDQEVGLECDGPDTDLCVEGRTVCTSEGVVQCTDDTDSTFEVCREDSMIDEDCDGLVDEADPDLSARPLQLTGATKYYLDDDGDGCGTPDVEVVVCSSTIPDGYSEDALDQDDSDGVCCGNGVVEASEQCDFNGAQTLCSDITGTVDPAVCTTDCRIDGTSCIPEGCGDGVVDLPETCDTAAANSDVECRANCTYCGDGLVTIYSLESCDPNSLDPPENCRDSCTYCGDGLVQIEEGETCDPEDASDDGYCDPVTCTRCGDGVLETGSGEECDDGNTVTEECVYGEMDCEICSAECALVDGKVTRCGDGIIQAVGGEECDDGNSVTERCPDGQVDCTVCDASCKFVAPSQVSHCGDGAIDMDEECDDGNNVDDDSCANDCRFSTNGSDDEGGGSDGCHTVRTSPLEGVFLISVVLLGLCQVRRVRTTRLNRG